MKPVEIAARGRAAVAMLESVMDQIDQIYVESAKGDADILELLGAAKSKLSTAQQRQLSAHDAALKKLDRKEA